MVTEQTEEFRTKLGRAMQLADSNSLLRHMVLNICKEYENESPFPLQPVEMEWVKQQIKILHQTDQDLSASLSGLMDKLRRI